MNDEDLTKITKAVREAVKEDVREIVKEEVEGALETISKDLKEVKDTQEQQLLPSVVTIETTIVAYGDMYKINNSNAKKLEKRIEVLENKSGVNPPPEFALTDVS